MKRLVIGMSGASGIPVALELLKNLRECPGWESCLVITDGARRTIELESEYTEEQIREMADHYYDLHDIGASIASGTFKTEGMVVVPCSMKTVAGIYSGYSDNLLLRAADVTLKERRKLVLVARETPLHTIHLRNMMELSRMGAIILPPVLTFYNQPENIQQMVEHIAAKVLDIYGIESKNFRRWS